MSLRVFSAMLVSICLLAVPCLQVPAQNPVCANGTCANQVVTSQYIVPQKSVVAPYQQIVAVPVTYDSYLLPVYQTGTPYYYSAFDAYAQRNALREIIREELRQFTMQQAGTQQQQGKMPVTPQPPANKPAQPQPQPPSTPAGTPLYQVEIDDVTPAEVQTKVVAAFSGKANCVQCHGGGTTLAGNFRLVTETADGYKLVKLSSDKRWKAYAMASVGAMPPSAATDANKAMESEHLPAVLQWASHR